MFFNKGMKRFFGKRILITGAASGLGKALALTFARKGWNICIADIHMARANEVALEVEKAGGKALVFECNISKESDFQDLASYLESEWGGLDILVNNAGISSSGSLQESSYDEWQRLLDINLLGVVRGCKVFTPMLAKQAHSHIVNVASFAGIASAPGMVTYNVAKAGVISLSESLRHELSQDNIDISVVCPAFFPTNLMESMNREETKAIVSKLMKRSGVTAEDVAAHIYKGIENRDFMLITHKDARIQYSLKRLSPDLFHLGMHQALKKMGMA
ncbi:MAG: SDR family oxidoreductase [Oleiphilus sp.]